MGVPADTKNHGMPSNTKVTIDHDEIRRWAQQRGGKPAVVKGTGIIRLDFPGYSGEGKLQPVDWDQFFERFEESKLALIYQDKTAKGQRSNFNKLAGRETVDLESGATKVKPARRRKQAEARTESRASTRASSRPVRKRAAAKPTAAAGGQSGRKRAKAGGRTARKKPRS